jgi:hypothetical protein
MATCPECKGEMKVTATVCPHCGYDFPLDQPEKLERRGVAYNAFADFSLVVGMFSAALGALAMLVVIVLGVFGKNFVMVASATIGFFIQVALYVVFQRVADMD